MAYSTQDDVQRAAGGEKILVQLSDLEDTGAVDTATVAAAIAKADAWIDSYVAKKRAVPLSPVPTMVNTISAEEAVYRLRSQRQFMTERDQRAHDQNEKWLDGVARGLVTLGVDPQPAESALNDPDVVVPLDADVEITRCNTRGMW